MIVDWSVDCVVLRLTESSVLGLVSLSRPIPCSLLSHSQELLSLRSLLRPEQLKQVNVGAVHAQLCRLVASGASVEDEEDDGLDESSAALLALLGGKMPLGRTLMDFSGHVDALTSEVSLLGTDPRPFED